MKEKKEHLYKIRSQDIVLPDGFRLREEIENLKEAVSSLNKSPDYPEYSQIIGDPLGKNVYDFAKGDIEFPCGFKVKKEFYRSNNQIWTEMTYLNKKLNVYFILAVCNAVLTVIFSGLLLIDKYN